MIIQEPQEQTIAEKAVNSVHGEYAEHRYDRAHDKPTLHQTDEKTEQAVYATDKGHFVDEGREQFF